MSNVHKTRLDLLLTERGLAESRSQAQRLVMAGQVRVDGQVASKPSDQVLETADLQVEHGPRYVSRGGDKLEGALQAFGLTQLQGRICADLGASTGGFTDCCGLTGKKPALARHSRSSTATTSNAWSSV